MKQLLLIPALALGACFPVADVDRKPITDQTCQGKALECVLSEQPSTFVAPAVPAECGASVPGDCTERETVTPAKEPEPEKPTECTNGGDGPCGGNGKVVA